MLLVVDTCLGACQVAVLRDGRPLAARSEPMQRGHQERLAPMTAEAMAEAGTPFSALRRIAVTLGPGSFTGIRVGLAFALGLRLAAGAEIAGIGALEALASSAGESGRACGVIDARRGQVYVQAFEQGRPLWPPAALAFADAAQRLASLDDGTLTIAGPGALLFGEIVGPERAMELAAPDLGALCRLAGKAPVLRDPRPLYLRAPDIRPPAP
ncbi:MAG: tRNA (adenosine(37)-N6)-threonylcarbamoyltransferase complex dimerization subunit type 1 TsaB [Caulobacteraceae bacterium]|nr:tRNA (adenosine(37)-N6)-threonylcarbamoyltransferase complex dimerization subunit type 1 TsaB [Caulobacteraceae bacterium]